MDPFFLTIILLWAISGTLIFRTRRSADLSQKQKYRRLSILVWVSMFLTAFIVNTAYYSSR